MFDEPVGTPLLGHRRSLVDTPTILNHDRGYQTRILGPPPAGYPVAASLFLKSAVTEEYDQSLAGQWHMSILKFSEPKVPTLRYAAGSVHINVAA